ncbi:hypothetical protein UT300012_23880 [Paraclostridium bifermentans]
MLVVLSINGVFNFGSAKNKLSAYKSSLDKMEALNTEMDGLVSETSKSRKKLQEVRGADAVDLESVDALYKAVSTLPGVKEINGRLLRISGENTKEVAQYKEGDKRNANADGIVMNIVVEDVNKFIKELEKLKTPYYSLNVVYPGSEIVIRYNTKGGQV